jgi:hypothetical protein
MPLVQPSLYDEDEEDLYAQAPPRSTLCPPSTLNHPDLHSVQKRHASGRDRPLFHTSIFRITLRNTDFPDGYREIVLLLCISMLPAILSSVLTRIRPCRADCLIAIRPTPVVYTTVVGGKKIWTCTSGVLVRSHGRTVRKLVYHQVLQSSYSLHAAAGVQQSRVRCLRHTHVVEVLRRLSDVEAESDIPRAVGSRWPTRAGHCPTCCTR